MCLAAGASRFDIMNNGISPTTATLRSFCFVSLPREIRDLIYEECFVVRASKADAELEDALLEGRHKLLGADRDTTLDDLLRVRHICPDKRPHHQIQQTLALLRTNRQIHAEAFAVLYGRNIFSVFFTPEERHSVWPCGSKSCTTTRASLISVQALMHIKHMSIHIRNPREFPGQQFWSDTAHLKSMIHNFCRSLAEHGKLLRTLSVQYHGCFGGQLESIRWALDPCARDPLIPSTALTVKVIDHQGP